LFQITRLQNYQITQFLFALKTKPSFPGIGKEVQEMLDMFAHPESHVPRAFRVESWHLAAAIDDPGPVAVASQGSSLSHSA
jgi:hypothetical protein